MSDRVDPDRLPGFRRSFIITPGTGSTQAAVEDDFHHMAVTLHHDGAVITSIEAAMHRAPWTTCPGALAVLERTFAGALLQDAMARGGKPDNCTHLYDLAVLAASHALDDGCTRYDIAVSDPVAGCVHAEIRCHGSLLMRWVLTDDVLAYPPEIAGTPLIALKGWIATLPPPQREAAKLLQWASFIAHGRRIPLAAQSDATRMPPNCYSFQPTRAAVAERVGQIVDFSHGGRAPLDS